MKSSNAITGKCVLSAVCCWFAVNTALGVPVVFDLRDTAAAADVEDGNVVRGGIAATLSALVQGNAGSLNQVASSFGVDAVNNTTPHDASGLLDGVDGAESFLITFDFDVLVLGLSLTGLSAGESGSFVIGANAASSLSDTGAATDGYSFSADNVLPSGASLVLAWVTGNGFSFDAFTVEKWTNPGDPSTPPTASVPDAGVTLTMLALSVVGMGLVRRRP